MNIPIGPHQRAGRRRRRGKTVVIAVVLVIFALLSSMNTKTIQTPGKWDRPTIQDLAVARIEYKLAGGPYGNAGILLDRYRQYGDYITGLVDDPALCGPVWVLVGGAKVLVTTAEVPE